MNTNADAVPSTPAAQWRVDGKQDPHGTQYDCERAALTLGTLTDDELANGAFMNYDRRQSLEEMLNPKPGQHMPIVWMTAVKERIRWLSRALERVRAPASKVQADHIADELREASRQFHNLTQGDPTVIIRPSSAEKRDAIVAAGERLRAALAASSTGNQEVDDA